MATDKITPEPREVRLEDFASLDEAIRTVGDGGRVMLYEGPCDIWDAHPQGVVVKIGNRFLLNGKEPPLYEGPCDNWNPHPQGVVVRVGDRFLLNGKEPPLYEGPWDDWCAHLQGVVVRVGDRFLLNGGEPTVCEPDKREGWGSHTHGKVVDTNQRSQFSSLVLVVHLPYDPFDPHPGIVVPEWIQEL